MVRIAYHNIHPVYHTGGASKNRRSGPSAAERANLPEEMIAKLREIADKGVEAKSFGELVPHQSAARDANSFQLNLQDSNTRRALAALCQQFGIESLDFEVDPEQFKGDDHIVVHVPADFNRGATVSLEAEILPGVFMSADELAKVRRQQSNPYYQYVAKSADAKNEAKDASSVVAKGGSFMQYAESTFPDQLATYEQNLQTVLQLIFGNDGEGTVSEENRAKLKQFLGYDPVGADGKVSEERAMAIAQFVTNQFTERCTMLSNLAKTGGDLLHQLANNLRVA